MRPAAHHDPVRVSRVSAEHLQLRDAERAAGEPLCSCDKHRVAAATAARGLPAAVADQDSSAQHGVGQRRVLPRRRAAPDVQVQPAAEVDRAAVAGVEHHQWVVHGAGGQPYALVIGTTGIGMTLAGALLWQYPPSIGTEPAAAAAATATGVRTAAARVGAGGVSKGFLAEAGECWATFTAPFVQRPGAMIHRLFAFFSIIHLHVKDDPLPREARDKRTANCTIIAQFPIDSEQGQFAELPLKTTGKSAKFRRLLLCNSE